MNTPGLAIPSPGARTIDLPEAALLSAEYLARLEQPARGVRVALAEDDPATRDRIAGMLRRDGHDVLEAADGSELFEMVEAAIWVGGRRRAPLSLILTDAHMPGFSGVDVLWILRAAFWEVPVVLMADVGDESSRREARELGASGLLDKPVGLADLRRTIRIALRGGA